jgi:hypothetical protein
MLVQEGNLACMLAFPHGRMMFEMHNTGMMLFEMRLLCLCKREG